MNIRINQNPILSVKQNTQQKINVFTISGGVQVPAQFGDLEDYDETGVSDKYVIMYDAATGTYKAVNPDAILSAAASGETTQPGLPSDFVDTLDTDLDDRIDLDAGTW